MFRKALATTLIVIGLLLLFGAAGQQDMYDAADEVLPLIVIIRKIGVGAGMMLLGIYIKRGDI